MVCREITKKIPFIIGMLIGAHQGKAVCTSLKSGPIVFDAYGCAPFSPEKTFDPSQPRYQWIHDMDAPGREALFASYRGLYLRGKVIKSEAVQSGVSKVPGVLMGETIFAFVPPGVSGCEQINGKRFKAHLSEKCCDGSGNAPCLLGTEYVLTKPEVIGTASSGAGDAMKAKSAQSKDYAAGRKAFDERQYRAAAQAFEQAKTKGELDIPGFYRLGVSYREMDQCRDAIPPLKHVHDLEEKNAIWADDEKVARQATFLLARCYAKTNQAAAAVLVLNRYLIEPSKYLQELRDSLNHKDFGWIHTSKEYRDYKDAALKKLKGLKLSP